MTEDTFACILKRRNPELHKCLEEMHHRAENEWVHLLQPDHGSHSGLIHLRNVERNADKMVPLKLKERFSDGEIFLLLASILLHDLGRIIPDRPRQEILVRSAVPEQGEGRRQAKKGMDTSTRGLFGSLRDIAVLFGRTAPRQPGEFLPERMEPCLAAKPEQMRERCLLAGGPEPATCSDDRRCFTEQKTHACRSCYLIQTQWPHFGLPDEQISVLCGVITFCHQIDVQPEKGAACIGASACAPHFAETSLEPYGTIRVPLLAAILRIADETEDSWTRAFRQHWYEYYSKNRLGDMYKAFRRGVADVEFLPDAECIVMHLHDIYPPDRPRDDDEEAKNREDASRGRFVKDLTQKVAATREALAAWQARLEQAGIVYQHVFVQKEGRLYINPPSDSPSLAVSLEDEMKVLEAAFQTKVGDEEPFLCGDTIHRYVRQIGKLILGTNQFQQFRWSSIEGAIGEPIDGRKKWAILRMGRAHPDLRITEIENGDESELEIRLTDDGAEWIKKVIKRKAAVGG